VHVGLPTDGSRVAEQFGCGVDGREDLLLLAAIPPLVFDKDLRGLHDRAARTIVIRI